MMIQARTDPLPTLLGPCPACGHECAVEITATVAQGGVPSSAAEDEPVAELSRQVDCNCAVNHEWPSGVRAGCGRFWYARLTLTADGAYRLSRETERNMITEVAALRDAQADQGKRIQGAAEKWIGAVTALYGLFSLTGVITAKDALAGLSAASRSLIAAALVTGLASAAASLVFGYRAAYGWPKPVTVDDNTKLAAWYRNHRNHVPDAARRLQLAVYCALGSLTAITVLTLLMWFLPRTRV
jgi:hypothetical protein